MRRGTLIFLECCLFRRLIRAGTLTAELSLTTSQGNTTQATTFGATADGGRFTFEISAVADAPTLNLATDLSVTERRMLREVLIYLVWYRHLRRVEIL